MAPESRFTIDQDPGALCAPVDARRKQVRRVRSNIAVLKNEGFPAGSLVISSSEFGSRILLTKNCTHCNERERAFGQCRNQYDGQGSGGALPPSASDAHMRASAVEAARLLLICSATVCGLMASNCRAPKHQRQ